MMEKAVGRSRTVEQILSLKGHLAEEALSLNRIGCSCNRNQVGPMKRKESWNNGWTVDVEYFEIAELM